MQTSVDLKTENVTCVRNFRDKRILITGAGGFVGPYLVGALKEVFGQDVSLLLTSRRGVRHTKMGCIEQLDVCDVSAISRIFDDYRPTQIIHLAGIASIGVARSNPELTWKVHVAATLNLARTVLKIVPECSLVYVGSGQVYGGSANAGDPLDESCVLEPLDDYAVTKAAADLALGAMARQGLRCIRLRPFNHTGPGQSDAFVVPTFAMQIARIEAGISPPKICVGNLESKRDFLDVRDVANCYALAAKRLDELIPGEIFNIASGLATPIQSILDILISKSRKSVTTEPDSSRMRPSDVPIFVGNADHARDRLDWKPEFELEETLTGVLNDCRLRVSGL
jgi:GDP-4-dehydro-6-deoxy-D-mannose reductase